MRYEVLAALIGLTDRCHTRKQEIHDGRDDYPTKRMRKGSLKDDGMMMYIMSRIRQIDKKKHSESKSVMNDGAREDWWMHC
jgi:hypothetical protein